MARTAGAGDVAPERKLEVILFLSDRLCNGQLKYGSQGEAAVRFGLHRNTIRDIWARRSAGSLGSGRHGTRVPDIAPEALEAMIAQVPLEKRQTVVSAAAAVNVSVSRVQRNLGKGKVLRIAKSHVKPALTEDHKLARLRFAILHVERPIGRRSACFLSMYDVIHVDEKWFYIQKVANTFILTQDEQAPFIKCKSKRFITKIMFFCAIARPRYDAHKRTTFDGKLCIFPIIDNKIAQRTTANQTKGEVVMRPKNVTGDVYKDILVNSLLPTIFQKWPRGGKSRPIWIQQDNASPHSVAEAAIASTGAAEQGWDIRVRKQPAKSPDFNILDLGFFNSIQALQQRTRSRTIPELVDSVCQAFEAQDPKKIDKCFLTLQRVMEQSMLVEGDNTYKIPHAPETKVPMVSAPCSDLALVVAENAVAKATLATKPT